MRHLRVVLALLVLASLWPLTAQARSQRRVEVVEVSGIIDGPAQHAIFRAIRDATHEDAQLVVIQLDSKGAVGEQRGSQLIDRIRASRVPIAVWIPPGGVASNSAAVIAIAANYTAMGPASRLGPIRTDDLGSAAGRDSVAMLKQLARTSARTIPFEHSIGPRTAIRGHLADGMATAITEVLQQVDGKTFHVAGRTVRPVVDPNTTAIRFRKLGLIGGALHAAAKPSIAYLLLLVGLVGIVFELFHPSTGPAGVSGLVALGLSIYGVVSLNGSWAGFVLICFGVASFCLDLATERLGPLSVLGFLALVGGSLLLFHGPFLRVSPFVLAFGVIAMTMFLVGAMTRVLRDLRAIARGELEVRDAHPHTESNGG